MPSRPISDALRMELRPFGIAVSVIEPGPIRSAFAQKINATLPAATQSGPYADFHAAVAARINAAYQPRARNMVLTPHVVARAIVRAALSRRPHARYPVGLMARGTIMLSRLLPDRGVDALIRLLYPVPQPPEQTNNPV
jgi:short-subunit dehydrogenase